MRDPCRWPHSAGSTAAPRLSADAGPKAPCEPAQVWRTQTREQLVFSGVCQPLSLSLTLPRARGRKGKTRTIPRAVAGRACELERVRGGRELVIHGADQLGNLLRGVLEDGRLPHQSRQMLKLAPRRLERARDRRAPAPSHTHTHQGLTHISILNARAERSTVEKAQGKHATTTATTRETLRRLSSRDAELAHIRRRTLRNGCALRLSSSLELSSFRVDAGFVPKLENYPAISRSDSNDAAQISTARKVGGCAAQFFGICPHNAANSAVRSIGVVKKLRYVLASKYPPISCPWPPQSYSVA